MLIAVEEKDYARIWTKESPMRAPQPRANKNLMRTLKQASEKHFLKTMTIIAAMNPIRETPKPAKKPNPQICGLVRWAYSS